MRISHPPGRESIPNNKRDIPVASLLEDHTWTKYVVIGRPSYMYEVGKIAVYKEFHHALLHEHDPLNRRGGGRFLNLNPPSGSRDIWRWLDQAETCNSEPGRRRKCSDSRAE